MQIGKTIVTLRNSKGIKQDFIAKQAGITATHLCNIERGKAKPSPAMIIKLAKVFDISPGELVLLSLPPHLFVGDEFRGASELLINHILKHI